MLGVTRGASVRDISELPVDDIMMTMHDNTYENYRRPTG